ncbi:Hypothetical_protein [Hexamita inflata]|uniref:Hypothetical_protein n=1 Tax=Hexamita inflata TaxID=28002 RepID=A0AA86Q980_9EUKA|nr:Hypothetical protein HINF_LOCUS42261 [Hexamita inflata]
MLLLTLCNQNLVCNGDEYLNNDQCVKIATRGEVISLFCDSCLQSIYMYLQCKLVLLYKSSRLTYDRYFIGESNIIQISLGWPLVYQQHMNQYRKDDIQK